jgi:hypothetical protein
VAARTISRRGNRRSEEDYDPQDDREQDFDADEEDERPARRSRRSRDEDEEDEKPRGRSRRSRDDDEDEDEKPRRSRRSRDDDEEDERPRRTSRRSRDEDDDDDERPRGKRGPIKSTAGRGWGGYDKVKDSGGGDFAKTWQVPNKQTLIKFLEPEPFSTYAEHWLEGMGKGKKKSFVCLGDDCPLCDDLGDRPRGYALFNILDLSDPDNPTVEAWKVGRQVANIIKAYADDKKTSPIDRVDLYWNVHRTENKTGKGTSYNTILNPVKARDLDEDWDVEPFSEKELAEFEADLHSEEQHVFINTRKDLKAIAAEYDD